MGIWNRFVIISGQNWHRVRSKDIHISIQLWKQLYNHVHSYVGPSVWQFLTLIIYFETCKPHATDDKEKCCSGFECTAEARKVTCTKKAECVEETKTCKPDATEDKEKCCSGLQCKTEPGESGSETCQK